MEVSEIILCVDLSYQIDDTYNPDDTYNLEDTDSFEYFITYLLNITETFEGLYITVTDTLNINANSAKEIIGDIFASDLLLINISEENSNILEIFNDMTDSLNLDVSYKIIFEANTSGTDPPIIILEYKDYDEEIYCDDNYQINDEYILYEEYEFDLLFNYIFNIHTSNLNTYNLSEDINIVRVNENEVISTNLESNDILNIDVKEIAVVNIISNDILNINVDDIVIGLNNSIYNEDAVIISSIEETNILSTVNSSDVLKIGYNSETSINSNFESNDKLNIAINEIPNVLIDVNSTDILKFNIFEICDKTSILLYKLNYEELKNAQDNCWSEEVICDAQLIIDDTYTLEDNDRFEILFSYLLLSPWKNVWEQYVKVNGEWKFISKIYQKINGQWKTSK